MTTIQSAQDFVRALKSTTDPPSTGGPSKVQIARIAWDDKSFHVPGKAEVIADWILTKFLKEKETHRDKNPLADIQYWNLLADVIKSDGSTSEPRPLKTWLGAILIRTPIAPIVSSYLSSYVQCRSRHDTMSEVVATCLVILWPLGVQKALTEAVLECFGLSLPLVKDYSTDENILKVAGLVADSYRGSLANNSNKKRLSNLFLQHHFQRWLECIGHHPADGTHARLLGSIYSAGIETCFSLDVLRQLPDPKAGHAIIASLQALPGSSKHAVLTALPRIFSSFLQAIKKYRASLFGQGSATSDINATGMLFFIASQPLLDSPESSVEVWEARSALLDIVKENHLFTRSLSEAETSLRQICELAIKSLSVETQNIALALECLSRLAQIDYDLILPTLPHLLPKLLHVSHGGCSTPTQLSFITFLDVLLEYYIKTRTIPDHISNLMDIALSPKQIAPAECHDPHDICQSMAGSLLLHPSHLDRLSKIVQNFVTSTQTFHLAKTIVESLETAWADLETAARQMRKNQRPSETSNTVDVSSEILYVRFSLLATFANVVLSSLPAQSVPPGERATLDATVSPLRDNLVARVAGKLAKKLHNHSSQDLWPWQIAAAAALRLGYGLDASRNLALPQLERNKKLIRRVAELAGNGDILPELILESFRYLLSKATLRNQTEAQGVIDQALTHIEQNLSQTDSQWSGYTYQLTYGEEGKAKSALALLHILVERRLPVIDQCASAEQLRRFIAILMSAGVSSGLLPNRQECRSQDVLLTALRSAQFWELPNMRPVLLSYLTDSTTILDKSHDAEITIQMISLYKLMLYVPMEYLTKSSRMELVKRALSEDVSLGCKAGNANVARALTTLRVFLKRVFVYTGFVEPPALGFAGFLEHLMNGKTPETSCIDATLDLIELYFGELLRSAARGKMDIVKVFGSMETWVVSKTNALHIQGIVRMIELMTTEFAITNFSEDITAPMRALHMRLVAGTLPRVSSLLECSPKQGVVRDQHNMIALWSCLLSFGHWVGQKNEIELFGRRMASRIIATTRDQSASMDETRVMTLAMMLREMQCLPDHEGAAQLEQTIAVYVSFALVSNDKSRERLDGHISQACKNLSISNYVHVLNLVSETITNPRSDHLVQVVGLAARLLKDNPPSTLKHMQAFAIQCINAFAAHPDIFVNGPLALRIAVLDYVVQLCSERPAALRSSDLSGIWHLLSEFLAPSRPHDDETSTAIYHRIVSSIGAVVRLRRDLVAWTLPHLAMALRQLILCLRACRPMLGAKQTGMVMDSQPRWINAKQALGAEEAKALSRLMETLNTKSVVRIHTQAEAQKVESLSKPFSKHAVYVVKAYVECMNDPLCVVSVEVRRKLEPGLFVLCGMVNEYARDAVMVSAMDAGGKAIMKALWRDFEKQKYVGQG